MGYRCIFKVHIIKTHFKPYGCISCNFFSGSDYRELDHLMVKLVGILPCQRSRCYKAYSTQQGLSRHFTRNLQFGTEEQRRIYMHDAGSRLPETCEPLATCRICRIRFLHDGELFVDVLSNHFVEMFDRMKCVPCETRFRTLEDFSLHFQDNRLTDINLANLAIQEMTTIAGLDVIIIARNYI